MKQRLIPWFGALLILLWSPAILLASSSDADIPSIDGRLEGYGQSVSLDAASTGQTYLLLVVLAAITIGVLFKSAHRTHLD